MIELRRIGQILVWIIVAVSFALTKPRATSAEDSKVPGAPHLFPQDTLFYIRLDNADDLREDFEKSSVGRMLRDPKLESLSRDMFDVAGELFNRFSQQSGLSLEDALQIPTGQVALAVMPGTISDRSEELLDQEADDESEEAIRRRLRLKRQQANAFATVILVEAGENADQLAVLLEEIEANLEKSGYVRRTKEVDETEIIQLLPPGSGRWEFEFFIRGGTLVFGIGHRSAEQTLNRWLSKDDSPTLANRADFASVMSRSIGAEDTQPQVTFYIDAYRLIERFVKRQSMAALFWPIIQDLGIDKIRGIGGSIFRGGEEFESISHVHVLIDPPRDGLFGLLRPEEVDVLPPQWVPADVTNYTTLRWDLQKTYENLGKVMAKFQRGSMLEQMIEKPAEEILGLSFQEDLLPNLTGRYVNCAWIERPIKLNSQSQLHALELVDPETAKSALETFRAARPNEVKAETIGGSVVYFVSESATPFGQRVLQRREAARKRREEQQLRAGADSNRTTAQQEFRAGLRKQEPCIVILGNWAIYCDSRKFVEHMINSNRDAGTHLIDVPEYDLILSELGGKLDGEKPFMISFLRSSDYVRQMYELASSPDTRKFLRARSKQEPIAGRIIELLEQNELPPFEEFEKYFAPSGFFAYDEPTGIHFGMFTLRAE